MTEKTATPTVRSVINQLDPLKHMAPRLDRTGLNKNNLCVGEFNALKSIEDKNLKIPQWWQQQNSPSKQTRTQMLHNRKVADCAHMSYDLDGDGYVGNSDYLISKLFDKDQDGILNEHERKTALEAIKHVSLFDELVGH